MENMRKLVVLSEEQIINRYPFLCSEAEFEMLRGPLLDAVARRAGYEAFTIGLGYGEVRLVPLTYIAKMVDEGILPTSEYESYNDLCFDLGSETVIETEVIVESVPRVYAVLWDTVMNHRVSPTAFQDEYAVAERCVAYFNEKKPTSIEMVATTMAFGVDYLIGVDCSPTTHFVRFGFQNGLVASMEISPDCLFDNLVDVKLAMPGGSGWIAQRIPLDSNEVYAWAKQALLGVKKNTQKAVKWSANFV